MLVLAANFFYKTLTWKEFKVHNSLFDKIYFIFFPEQTVKHFQVVTLELRVTAIDLTLCTFPTDLPSHRHAELGCIKYKAMAICSCKGEALRGVLFSSRPLLFTGCFQAHSQVYKHLCNSRPGSTNKSFCVH